MTTETPKPRSLEEIKSDADEAAKFEDTAWLNALIDEAVALGAASRASPEEGRRDEVVSVTCPRCDLYFAHVMPPAHTTENEWREESAEGWIPSFALGLLRDHFTLAVYPSPGMVSPRVEAVRVRVTILPGAPAVSKEGERHE